MALADMANLGMNNIVDATLSVFPPPPGRRRRSEVYFVLFSFYAMPSRLLAERGGQGGKVYLATYNFLLSFGKSPYLAENGLWLLDRIRTFGQSAEWKKGQRAKSRD